MEGKMTMTRHRPIIALILTYVVFAMLLNSVGAVILQSIQSFGVEKPQAGRLEAFKDLPIAIASFLVASFLARFGYRRAMMLGLALVGSVCLIVPFLATFWSMKVLFAAIGVGFALTKVAAYSSIGLLTDDEKGHASFTNLVEGLFMVGVLGGSWLFSAFVDASNPLSLKWLYFYWLIGAAAMLTCALWAVSPFDETAAQHSSQDKVRSKSSGQRSILPMLKLLVLPSVAAFLTAAFLYVLIEQALGTWLPTFNAELLHLPADMSIQAGSLFAGCIALGRLSAGAALRRVHWLPFLILCLAAAALLMAVALPLADLAPTVPPTSWRQASAAVFILPLVGLFLAPLYPAINSVILSALPKPDHAPMTGLIVVFSALGGTLGSFITGLLFANLGGRMAFYMALLPMAALVAALIALARFMKARDSARHGSEAAS
jgi:MFS transporter, FHS family, glucose/mannose:H+ symporter